MNESYSPRGYWDFGRMETFLDNNREDDLDLKRWDIVDAFVVFNQDLYGGKTEEESRFKPRPVVYLKDDPQDDEFFFGYPVTSSEKKGRSNLILGDFSSEGLDRPSIVRLGMKARLKKDRILGKRGRMTPRDVNRLLNIRDDVVPWFKKDSEGD